MNLALREQNEVGRLWSALKLVDTDDTLGDIEESSINETLMGIAAYAAFVYSAYRGYKRNKDSIGYGAAWGFFASVLPIPAVGFTLLQDKGFRWS